jgi:hypothetical protein
VGEVELAAAVVEVRQDVELDHVHPVGEGGVEGGR